MKNFYLLFALLFVAGLCSQVAAQQPATETPPAFGIKLGGFVKVDYMFDSRQTVAPREGHFNLFPAAASKGADGEDVNATPNFNMLAIQSRLKGTITAPDFFSAKTSGVIEGEFFGHTDADINGFRLRHAFIKLDWAKSSLLFGQTWHPMFVAECFADVYNFNTGAPFQPFSRNPQIRFTTKGKVKIIAAAMSQRDFASRGPNPTTGVAEQSSAFLRNAVIPNLHGQLQFGNEKMTAGAGVDYKAIKPRLKDLKGNKTDETVAGLSYIAYLKVKAGKVTWKVEGTYGENLADHIMMGGIAETGIDSTGGAYSYSPIGVASVWTELLGGNDKMEWGLFVGYAKNLGTDKPLVGSMYAFQGSVDNAMRIAPRIGWKSGKMKIGFELEYTAAQYGKFAKGTSEVNVKNEDGSEIEAVSNIRGLLIAMYSF